MENNLINRNGVESVDIIGNKHINLPLYGNFYQAGRSGPNLALDIFTAESCEEFGPYLESLGLEGNHSTVVLSSIHHYFYDAEEMKKVQTIINLRELNRIKNVKGFIRTLFHCLPPASNFIGCFVEKSKSSMFLQGINLPSPVSKRNSEAIENGIISRIPFINMLYSIMDSRTYNNLSRIGVTLLLEGSGFKVMDMTEGNGLIYFHARKFSYAIN